MSRRRGHGRRVLAVASALAVTVSLPANALASDSPSSTVAPSPIRATAQRVAATETHRLAKAATSQTGQTGTGQLEKGSFFKSPAGVAVIAAFGVGLGYALYSASHDRIRSSER